MDRHEFHKNETKDQTTALAERIASGELPNLEQQRHTANEVDAAWQEDGYKPAQTYLDEFGDLLMVADKQTPEIEEADDRKTDKEFRVLFDNEICDITVPPEFQGVDRRFRSQRGSIAIYDIGETPREELPPDLQRVVAKFGSKLSKHYRNPEIGSRRALGSVGYDIRDVTREFEVLSRRQIKRDEGEAYEIEAAAQRAARELKIGMFVLPKARRVLRDQAYRDEINRHNTQDRQQ